MGARRVTPAAIVTRKSVIGGTKIGSRNEYRRATGMAPLGVISALDLKASTTAESIVVQSSTQSGSVNTIPLAVEIPIPTRTTCKTTNPYKQKRSQNVIRREESREM